MASLLFYTECSWTSILLLPRLLPVLWLQCWTQYKPNRRPAVEYQTRCSQSSSTSYVPFVGYRSSHEVSYLERILRIEGTKLKTNIQDVPTNFWQLISVEWWHINIKCRGYCINFYWLKFIFKFKFNSYRTKFTMINSTLILTLCLVMSYVLPQGIWNKNHWCLHFNGNWIKDILIFDFLFLLIISIHKYKFRPNHFILMVRPYCRHLWNELEIELKCT